MGKDIEIYCLNKRHSKIVCEFLMQLEDIIDKATYYDEDFEGYKKVMEKFITFHNGLGIYALLVKLITILGIYLYQIMYIGQPWVILPRLKLVKGKI